MTKLTYKFRQAHQDRQDHIIDEYRAFLAHRDPDVILWDVDELPFEKEEIAMAFLTKLHNATDDNIAKMYEGAVLTLSDYQVGVGSPLRLPDTQALAAMADVKSLRQASNDVTRYQSFASVVKHDLADLKSRNEVARVFNKKLTGEIRRSIFKMRRRISRT